MIISHTRKFVFVHVPKTAGNAIVAALSPHIGKGVASRDDYTKHFTAQQIRAAHFGDGNWSKYFSFALIRNPWDQLHSDYHYCRSFADRLDAIDNSWAAKIRRVAKMGFPQFVTATVAAGKLGFVQTYCHDLHGRPLVKMVRRYEDLPNVWPKICARLQLPELELTRQNETQIDGKPRPPYRDDYTPELRDLVAKRFRFDIEKFGYKF